MPIYSVSQVTLYVKESLEQDHLLSDLWISGEVSNLRAAPSGHSYFTLKDPQSQLRSVIFRSGRSADLLHDGRQVTVHGRISFYEVRGDVQMVADLVMPEGAGPLALELENLKMQLEADGLFEASRKRSLPRFPKVIGLVTSPTGAVVHDICNVIGRRYRLAEVLMAPSPVQGDGAAQGIVSALHALNLDSRSDLIILARGGGSLEELWPFNEESVARAIYASRIPVVSAVGHETDYTIADYVADVRAPTPSAAAEMVVPDRQALLEDVRAFREGLGYRMVSRLSRHQQEVDNLGRHIRSRAPDIDGLRSRIDDLASRAGTGLNNLISLTHGRLEGLEKGLKALNPSAILKRGYSIVQKQPSGEVVARVDQVRTGDELELTVSDGAVPATVGSQPRKPRTRKQPVRAGARLL